MEFQIFNCGKSKVPHNKLPQQISEKLFFHSCDSFIVPCTLKYWAHKRFSILITCKRLFFHCYIYAKRVIKLQSPRPLSSAHPEYRPYEQLLNYGSEHLVGKLATPRWQQDSLSLRSPQNRHSLPSEPFRYLKSQNRDSFITKEFWQ